MKEYQREIFISVRDMLKMILNSQVSKNLHYLFKYAGSMATSVQASERVLCLRNKTEM